MKPKILMILLLTLTPFFALFAGASGKIIGTFYVNDKSLRLCEVW